MTDSNNGSEIWLDGVTISQVYAVAGSADEQTQGSDGDLDGDGSLGNDDESDEFVKIENFSDEAVDISGWQIWVSDDGAGSDGAQYHTFADGTTLDPGESVYVITEYSSTPVPDGVVEANGDGTESFEDDDDIIHNDFNGEVALVNTSDSDNIEYIQWTMDATPDDVTDYTGFPTNSDGSVAARVTGTDLPVSVEDDLADGYINAAQRTFGINHDAQPATTYAYDPTTGQVSYYNGANDFPNSTDATDQVGVDLDGLTFYSVLPDNNDGSAANSYFDIDGDGTVTNSDQFVSFINTNDTAMDISGYQVYVSSTNADSVNLFHTFDEGTILEPGEVIYVVPEYSGTDSIEDRLNNMVVGNANTDVSDSDQLIRASINGELALYDPTADEYIQMSFDADPADISSDISTDAILVGEVIEAIAEEGTGNDPTNADTYRYNHDTGIVEEIPQIVEISAYAEEQAVCFCRGSLILTSEGNVPVEDLRVGDLVETFDNGLQEIRWVGSSHVNSVGLLTNPKLYPIRIGKGALGWGFPEKELIVSPQHRVLISSKIAKRIFDTAEVLVAANKLVGIDGIEVITDVNEVDYFHILFDQHELVFANGIVAESLLPGKEALNSVGEEAREEIIALFPEFKDGIIEPKPVRFMANEGKLVKRLVARHIQNEQSLLN